MNGSEEQKKIEARRKFVTAFNSTMVKIWKERIIRLGVIGRGTLYRSVSPYAMSLNADASEFRLDQQFKTYGLFQNYGVGRETPRGNPGDIGRPKVRRPRPWYDRKYFASVMNIKDFMLESFSLEYLALFSDVFDSRALRARQKL